MMNNSKFTKYIMPLTLALSFSTCSPVFANDFDTVGTGWQDEIDGTLGTGVTTDFSDTNFANDTINIDHTSAASVVTNTYDKLNIPANHILNMLLKNEQISINKVTGAQVSQILGTLTSDAGTVFLINPNGVLFGANSFVNVNSLVVSTLSNVSVSGTDVTLTRGAVDPASVQIKNGAEFAAPGSIAFLASAIKDEGILIGQDPVATSVSFITADGFTFEQANSLDISGKDIVNGNISYTAATGANNNSDTNIDLPEGGTIRSGQIDISGDVGAYKVTVAALMDKRLASDFLNLVNLDGTITALSLPEELNSGRIDEIAMNNIAESNSGGYKVDINRENGLTISGTEYVTKTAYSEPIENEPMSDNLVDLAPELNTQTNIDRIISNTMPLPLIPPVSPIPSVPNVEGNIEGLSNIGISHHPLDDILALKPAQGTPPAPISFSAQVTPPTLILTPGPAPELEPSQGPVPGPAPTTRHTPVAIIAPSPEQVGDGTVSSGSDRGVGESGGSIGITQPGQLYLNDSKIPSGGDTGGNVPINGGADSKNKSESSSNNSIFIGPGRIGGSSKGHIQPETEEPTGVYVNQQPISVPGRLKSNKLPGEENQQALISSSGQIIQPVKVDIPGKISGNITKTPANPAPEAKQPIKSPEVTKPPSVFEETPTPGLFEIPILDPPSESGGAPTVGGGIRQIGVPVDINLEPSSGEQFDKPIKLEFDLKELGMENLPESYLNNLSIYVQNPETFEWETVGGNYDPVTKAIQVYRMGL